MSREIKFRAWNKNTQYMWDWDRIKNELYLAFFSQSYWEIMQYTGLKDKNGKEIYEGDIIGAFYFVQDKLTVIFMDGCYQVNNDQDGETGQLLSEYLRTYPNKVEIIGNVYENPELLK